MANDQVVVDLTTDEEITVTYWKVCNITYEVERSDNGKDGYLDVWIAKCYKDGNDYIEIPELGGINVKIEGGEFSQFEAYGIIPSSGATCFDFIRTVTQFLIDKGYIDGTLIVD